MSTDETDQGTTKSHIFADDYEVLSILGEGGLSVVYKARYLPLDQLVALKVLHAHLAQNQTVVQRLRLEAKVARRLDHPNIVRVLRLHISKTGDPFLVSDFVRGRTIQEALAADGPFNEARFHHVFSQIFAALEHAHNLGIVHRDIKPSNIMLTDESNDPDRVKVLDFGLAKVLADCASITQNNSKSPPGSVLGSPCYMSPEQGAGGQIDARSDIYSLGCVMYEALTGVAAFSGESALQTLYQHAHITPPSFREAAPSLSISPTLEAAVFAALSKDPFDRPQSIAELRLLLEGKLPALASSGKQGSKQRPWFRAAVVVTPLAVSVVAVWCCYLWQCSTQPDQLLTDRQIQASREAARELANLKHCRSAQSAFAAGNRLLVLPDDNGAYTAFKKANTLITADTPIRVQHDIKSLLVLLGLRLGKSAECYPVALECEHLSESLDPMQHAEAVARLSSVLWVLKREGEAIEQQERAAKLAEDALRKNALAEDYQARSGAIWRGLGDYYQAAGRYSQAEPALRQSLKHNLAYGSTAQIVSARYALAQNLLTLGKAPEAVVHMNDWYSRYKQAGPSLIETLSLASIITGLSTMADAKSHCGDAAGTEIAIGEAVNLARKYPDQGQVMEQLLHTQCTLFYRLQQLEKGDSARRNRETWEATHSAISDQQKNYYSLCADSERQKALLRREKQ